MRRKIVAMLVTSLIATLVVACDSSVSKATSKTVVSGRQTRLVTGGYQVVLPADGAKAGVSATLKVAPATVAAPEGMTVLSDAATVSVPGGITKPATVIFKAPEAVLNGSVMPVVVWQDDQGGLRWVPTTYAKGNPAVSATVDHFSWGFLSGIDVKKWASDRAKDFTNYVAGRSGVAQPTCGGETATQADGVTVTSDGGDRVKWCFGVENGSRILKVANNERTWMQISYPSGWQVVDGLSVSLSLATVSRNLGMLAVTPKGTASRLVDGGDTLTLKAPDESSGVVTAETSLVAWAVSGIFFGAEVFSGVAKAAGSTLGNAAKSALDRITVFLGQPDSDAGDALKDCTKGASDLTDANEVTAKEVLKFSLTCGSAIMRSQVEDVAGYAAGVLLTMVDTAVGLILTALNLLVSGVREIWDSFASFGGKSAVIYHITVKASAGEPPDSAAALVDFINSGKKVGDSKYEKGAYGPGQAMHSSYGMPEFMTPSRNVACAILLVDDSPLAPAVWCSINEHSFSLPAKAHCHDIDFAPNYFGVQVSGGIFRGSCLGGEPFDPYSNVLPYGSTIQQGPIACRSESAFLACADTTTKTGFIVSKTQFRNYGKVVTPG